MPFHANNSNEQEDTLGEEGRLKQYKNISKHEDLRRRRTECSVEIRKKKGDEMLMKRRNITLDDASEEEDNSFGKDSDTETKSATSKSQPRLSYEDVKKVLFNNPTLEQTISCFESLRKILSKSQTPPIAEVIESGLLSALVHALSIDNEKIQYESSWALTNIVSGTSEQTIAAVEAGATQPLVKLVLSDMPHLADQALWALANIAGDSSQLRDYVIKCGGVEAMMHLVERVDEMKPKHAQTLAWALSNICRHKNADIEVLRKISNGLSNLLQHQDQQVRQDACWAIAYLTDGADEQIELAVKSGALQSVIYFLRSTDHLVGPALRTLGNIATGSDYLTQEILDRGILQELTALLKRTSSTNIVKETCWLISNVIAGTQNQIQLVIDAGFIGFIVNVLASGDYKSQFEASWALSNLAQGGTSTQIYTMVQEKALPVMAKGLGEFKYAEMQNNLLESIYACLTTVSNHYPEQMDSVRDSIEEAGGLDHLEQLQSSDSQQVYSRAYKIISEFFSDDDEKEPAADENAAPTKFSF